MTDAVIRGLSGAPARHVCQLIGAGLSTRERGSLELDIEDLTHRFE